MTAPPGAPSGDDDGPVIFGAAAIRAAVGFPDLIEPVAEAFADFSRGLGESPVTVFAPAGTAGDVHVKSAWLPGRAVFTVKVATWFAARAATGRPPGSGFIAVHDAATGDLLALLRDDHYLSDIRTAAAGALAARLMARPDARTLAVLGTGVQAHLQVLAAAAVRPVETVLIWGRRREAAGALAGAIESGLPGVTASAAETAEQAVRDADMIVTATASTQPVLRGAWLRPGQHVTAVGADSLAKSELDAACFARAGLVVVDSRAEAPRNAGDLAGAIAAGAVTASQSLAEIGDLVLGRRPGRTGAGQITLAKLIGIGVQDLAAAQTALARLPGAGR